MIGRSEPVFVDSSAWYAMADLGEGRHSVALRINAELRGAGARLVTSNFVLAEAHALILGRLGRHAGLNFLVGMRLGNVRLVRVAPRSEERAMGIIEGYRDKAFSYTDATSFAVMRRLVIETAFTFDRHFTQFGLMTLGVDG